MARADVSASSFTPLTTRVYDSRTATKLAANETRSIKVAGVNGIPSSGVSAAEVTLTALHYEKNCNLWAAADGAPDPGTTALTYSLNYGDPMSNTAIVALSSAGKLEVHTCAATDLLIDVQGYYTPNSSGAGYTAVAPARVVDTRKGLGLPTARLTAGSTTKIKLAGLANVPSDKSARAVFANVTVVNPDPNTGSSIQPFAGSSPPGTSLNYTANGASGMGTILPLNTADGTVSVKVAASAPASIDLIIDIDGYFSGASSSGAFTPAASRLYDSRSISQIPAKSKRLVAVSPRSESAARTGASSAVINFQVLPGAGVGLGVLNAYSDDVADNGLSLVNFVEGTTRSNVATVQLGLDGGILLANHSSGPIDVVVDLQGTYQDGTLYPSTTPPVKVSSSDLAAGTQITDSTTPSFSTTQPSTAGFTYRQTAQVYSRSDLDNSTLVGSCQSGYVSPGASATCGLSQALEDGQTYYVRARSESNSGSTGAWTVSAQFAVWTASMDAAYPDVSDAESDDTSDIADLPLNIPVAADSSTSARQMTTATAAGVPNGYCFFQTNGVHFRDQKRVGKTQYGAKSTARCSNPADSITGQISVMKSVWWSFWPSSVGSVRAKPVLFSKTFEQNNWQKKCVSTASTDYIAYGTATFSYHGVKTFAIDKSGWTRNMPCGSP